MTMIRGNGYEPRFDRNYAEGRQGELLVEGTIEALKSGQGRVETKTKSYRDDWFYIETEHDPGRAGRYRPSGISVTESELWAFVVADTGVIVIVPTARLRAALDAGLGRVKEERDGSCPTRGRLVRFANIVALAYVGEGALPAVGPVDPDRIRAWLGDEPRRTLREVSIELPRNGVPQ